MCHNIFTEPSLDLTIVGKLEVATFEEPQLIVDSGTATPSSLWRDTTET